jgi:SAM-dependent methyltransferase
VTTALQEPPRVRNRAAPVLPAARPDPRPTLSQRIIEGLHPLFRRRCGFFEALLRSPADVFEYSVRSGAVVYQQFHGYNDFTNRVVLDLGCGGGGKTVYYATQGARQTIGVDFDPQAQPALTYARQHGLDVQFVSYRADGRIPLPDNTGDVVISSSVLEHVVDLAATLGEVRRVLKPGGLCLSRWHPWRSRYGGHLDTMIAVPFAHLVFREQDLVRSFYRLGVKRFGHCPGVCGTFHAHSTSLADLNYAYNRKSVRQMRQIITTAGFDLRERRYLWGTRELRWPHHIPERLRDYAIDYEVLICTNSKRT